MIVVFPLLGSIAWLWVGRPKTRPSSQRPQRNRPVAPDDDPDFLRGLRYNKPRDKPDDSR